MTLTSLTTSVLRSAPESKTARPDDDFRPAARIGGLIVLAFFGCLGTWAALAPLNAAVMGDGLVKVQGNRKSIQHLEGGTIRRLGIREGSHVRKGDLLVVFDDTQARAQVEILERQQIQYLAVEARLVAEATNATLVLPSSLSGSRNSAAADILQEQVNEFNVRRSALAGEREVLTKKMLQFQMQLDGVEAQKRALNERLQSYATDREIQERLVKKGIATRTRLNELERAESGLRGDLDAQLTSAEVTRQSIAEVKAQIQNLFSERQGEIAKEVRDVRTRLAEITPRLEAARATLEHTEIRSPADGTVVDLKFFNDGQVVRPSETLLEIVPDNSPLTVEARIRVEDVADVKPDMDAEVHFTSYKQKTLPIIHGKVAGISADRLTDERSQMPYYAVTVDVDPKELAESPNVQLYPGMPANVMITTEGRSALKYLLGPLISNLKTSFRER
ncbi:HlyD family type I secretion membrane fusion protein [Rhizobium tibeticum]|uniref:HlyD family type I secretion periplasmic adaptor subunit n=1 Tax=Rhizobium tibeticum TaxID=501024 RepID=UPI00277EE696|nr:HlyD family type I secretion periplasmic adaptor subunit [Rhizobium tibeticum]MDP9813555.1 HlyD family type I secretion membrane fusion protein [Rhizobium tibeticum]